MLKIENLEFSYDGDKKILKGLSLSLKNGKIGCILGPNGAGKSTLLKILAGILDEYKGKIYIEDSDFSELSQRERARIFAYVPQEFSLNFAYSCYDVVLMGRNPHLNPLLGPSKKDFELAKNALNMVGMGDYIKVPFIHLSGGQKRLVLLARSVVQDGKILLLDEPTAFLDFKNATLTMVTVKRMARELKKTVIVSLHDPNMAITFCDVVYLIKDGKIVASGTPDIVNSDTIREVYEMETMEIPVNGSKFIVPKNFFDVSFENQEDSPHLSGS